MAIEKISYIRKGMRENLQFSPKPKPPYPKKMMIELTNACNHRCIFCTNRKMTRKKMHIDEELLYRLLGEAFSLGVREVGFFMVGEPFLSAGLSKYIARAKSIGFEYLYITSNGVLATPERLREVIDSGLDSIKFSINAGTRLTYKFIHGKDEFDKVLEHIKFASEYRKKLNRSFRIFASYVITRHNQEECRLIEDLIGPFVDDIVFFNCHNQGGSVFEINEFLVKEGGRPVRKAPCSVVFNRFHITQEGYLTVCCVDFQNYLVVADLKKTTLKEAWHNELFVNIRKRHLADKLENTLCYNCLYNKNATVEPLTPQYAACQEG